MLDFLKSEKLEILVYIVIKKITTETHVVSCNVIQIQYRKLSHK